MSTAAIGASSAPPRQLTRLQRWAADVEAGIDNYFWPVAAAAITILFAFLLIKDLHLKLWTDEIYTIQMASLPGLADVPRAAMSGADAAPPLYAMIVHSILPLSPSLALAARIPSTIGFLVMVLATFAYARRRLRGLYALLAGLLAAALAFDYGSDGRAYGLELGCAGVSLLLWSLAAEGRNRAVTIPLLALSLAGMAAFHYFGLFFAGCLFLADLVRAQQKRTFDFALATALMAPPLLVIALHYPFIAAARPVQAHFWAQAHLHDIKQYYQELLEAVGPLFIVRSSPRLSLPQSEP